MKGALHVIGTRAFLKALRHGAGNNKMPTLMLGISTLLAASPGEIVSAAKLVDWLYGDDEEGGPEWALSNIRVAIARLRRQGVPITTHGWAGYSYEPVASGLAATLSAR